MSLALSLIIAITVFVLLLVADIIHPLLCAGILFMFYMWGLIAFDMTMLQKIFYPLGIVFFIAVKANLGKDLQTNSNSMDTNGMKPGGIVKGLKYHVLSISIGVVILTVMAIVSSTKGQFLGVAPLSVTGVGFFTMDNSPICTCNIIITWIHRKQNVYCMAQYIAFITNCNKNSYEYNSFT